MTMLDDQDWAALALTSRLVESAVKPLSAREFWALRRRFEPSMLLGMSAAEVTAELAIPSEEGDRIARLFDRTAGLAIALEKLDHSGIWTITGVGKQYPERLRMRLRDAAPAVLHGVGDKALLGADGLGVVGSRAASADASQAARDIAEWAAKSGLSLVSGAARGIDSDAMNTAFELGGNVVGIPADSLKRTVSRRAIRQGVAKGQICLATPYLPGASFSVGNAMGRNKLIYGLTLCTVVVTSDRESGGTWAGATEALKNGFGRVTTWTGPGSGGGNQPLVERGAVAFDDVSQMDVLLHEPVVTAAEESREDQLTLGF